MKVKYFWNESCTSNDFENEINKFIKGKKLLILSSSQHVVVLVSQCYLH